MQRDLFSHVPRLGYHSEASSRMHFKPNRAFRLSYSNWQAILSCNMHKVRHLFHCDWACKKRTWSNRPTRQSSVENLHYLSATANTGARFNQRKNPLVKTISDSDWAVCNEGRTRSTSRTLTTINASPILWKITVILSLRYLPQK